MLDKISLRLFYCLCLWIMARSCGCMVLFLPSLYTFQAWDFLKAKSIFIELWLMTNLFQRNKKKSFLLIALKCYENYVKMFVTSFQLWFCVGLRCSGMFVCLYELISDYGESMLINCLFYPLLTSAIRSICSAVLAKILFMSEFNITRLNMMNNWS